jgi:hypothetical protein
MADFAGKKESSDASEEYVNIDIGNLTPQLIAELDLTDEEIAQIELCKSKFFKRLVKPKTVKVGLAIAQAHFGVNLPVVALPVVGGGGGGGGGVSTAASAAASAVESAVAGISTLAVSEVSCGGGAAESAIDISARDFTIIVDRSGSMEGERWRQAEEAVKIIAPKVCEFDADGISLYFFSSRFQKFENVKTAEEVNRHFNDNRPSGSTALAQVLEDAVAPDNFVLSKSGKHKHRKPETILVVTDGVPDDRPGVEKVIVNAANSLDEDQELSVTIIQIGDDASAAKWLKKLDDELQNGASKAGKAKFDIVDTLSMETLRRINFADLVRLSICD